VNVEHFAPNDPFHHEGFREMDVLHLYLMDINSDLHTARVTSKSKLGFYPKSSEEREVPMPIQLIELLQGPHAPTRLQTRVSIAGGQPRVPHEASGLT